MPATGVFASLPSLEDLNLDVLPKSVPLPSLDTDVGKLKDQLLGSVSDPSKGLAMPDLSGAPSAGGFQRALDGPLGQLTAVDGRSLIASAKASLPKVQVSRAVPDVNGVVSQITTKLLPAGGSSPIRVDLALPPALGDFSAPLQRLAEAGAATPLRMLNVLLTVFDRFVTTVTDADKLRQFTTEAVQEILVAQVEALRDLLPQDAVEQAASPFDARFLEKYRTLLDKLEKVRTASDAELLGTVEAARSELLPALEQFRKSAVTMRYLQAGQTERLDAALVNVVGFATTQDAFLEGIFAEVEGRVTTVLGAVTGPVTQLAGMIEEIRAFLQEMADKATTAAESVSGQITGTLQGVGSQLDAAEQQILEVEKQIQAFIDKVDVGPAIDAFKQGCGQVVDGVDTFFTEVERVRKQLDDAVAQLDEQIRTRFDAALAQIKAQIEQLLATIVAVLDREEVKQVLDQARQGVDKLKTAIEQASLQQVFDLVITQTGTLEGKIQAIDTARLGTPQKTALKVGVKVIQEVKVDEVIRPELQDAFKQILDPLRELITLLKEKVLFVEQIIDQFNPGTLVTDTLDPYLEPVFDALDSFRPSQLLQPIKEALETLSGIVAELDPQKLLDQVQAVYGQLEQLVASLDPAPLNRLISGAANTALGQLEQVRDLYLDELLDTIQQTISLQKLLEGTGLQEIADAEFWTLLSRVLGGEFLDEITAAVDAVRDDLRSSFASLSYADAAARLKAASGAVDAQVALVPAAFLASATALRTRLSDGRATIEELEQRRARLASLRPQRPEVEAVLREMELQPALDLLAALEAVTALPEAQLEASLGGVALALRPRADALRAMREDTVKQAVPDLYETQFGAPVREFVAAVQAQLQPFQDAIAAIQGFLRDTLKKLPAQIDGAVSTVLETIRVEIRAVLEEVMDTIRAAREAIVRTITAVYEQVRYNVRQLNPALVLNSFAPSDFVGNGTDPAARAGVLALAQAISSPADDVAPYLRAKLDENQVTLVAGRSGDFVPAVLKALNDTLLDDAFAQKQAAAARARIRADQEKHEMRMKTAQGDDWIAARKGFLRTRSLLRQIDAAQEAYGSFATKEAGRIRLNRVILEVQYPDAVKMSLQGLHPFVVEQIANLYPQETVDRVDALYADLVTRVKTLPEELVRKPLDDAFRQVKGKLHETFDIQGIFRVLDLKLDGMEGDLSQGLDRLGIAYNRLLTTLDQRLA